MPFTKGPLQGPVWLKKSTKNRPSAWKKWIPPRLWTLESTSNGHHENFKNRKARFPIIYLNEKMRKICKCWKREHEWRQSGEPLQLNATSSPLARWAKLQLERVGTYLPIRFGTDLKIKIYKFQKIENTKNIQVLKC